MLVRGFFKTIFSLMLFLALFGLTAAVLARAVFLNPNALIARLTRAGYQAALESAITQRFADVSASAGVPASVFDGCLPKNAVSNDTYAAVAAMYEGRDFKPDESYINKAVFDALNGYLVSAGLADDAAALDGITQIAAAAAGEYADFAAFPFAGQLSQVLPGAKTTAGFIIAALAVLAAALAAVCFFINKTAGLSGFFADLGVSCLSCAAAFLLTGVCAIAFKPVSRLDFGFEAFSSALTEWTNVFFAGLTAAGAVFFAAGFALACVSARLRKNEEHFFG